MDNGAEQHKNVRDWLAQHPHLQSSHCTLRFMRQATSKNWPLGACWVVLSIGAPLIVWDPAPGASRTLYVAAAVTLAIAGFRIGALIGVGEPRPISAVAWLFVYVTMGVVPVAQIHTGLYVNLLDPTYLPKAQVLVLISVFAAELGGLFYRSAGAGSPGSAERAPGALVNLASLRAATFASLIFSAYYIFRLGGPASFFSSRETLANSFGEAGLREGSQAGSAIVMSLGQVPVAIVFVAWIVHYLGMRSPRPFAPLFTLSVLLIVNVIVNNPISNARYWFLTVLVGLLFSLPRMNPRRFRLVLVGAILAAVVVFPYSDYFRRDDRNSIQVVSVAETLSTKDYDQSVMAANGFWYEDTFGRTGGEQLAGSLLFWIPRSVWPEKSVDTGVLIGQHISQAGTTNLSSPLWTEVHLDFGYFGVLILFALLGILVARLDDWYVAAQIRDFGLATRTYVASIGIPFLAGYTFILLRGPLLQSMSRLSIILLVLAVLSISSPGKDRHRRSPLQDSQSGSP